MEIVDGLKYSKEHEWVKTDGAKAYVGITDYAQHSLGDIVFVELPEAGAELGAGDVIGAVDSVKAASEIYTPVSGKVIKVNEALSDSPELLNGQPYESWIAVLQLKDDAELDSLMDAEEYETFCGEQ
ncbi:MAG: glycine cleavage system protein GcvH [Eubacteriales bacterium]|nr:glycine cleavage system protein GcvH [Eubacteriales bacterium]